MTTLRQIERLWQARAFNHICRQIMEMRPEASVRLSMEIQSPTAAAALAVIRLDELSQGHTAFCAERIRTILAAQEADGGWGEPLLTALCLRALRCAAGEGLAIDRGMSYLASLQKSDGLWPAVPLRRMPADPYVSAFILYQLADDPRFAQAVRMDEAMAWFEAHQHELEPDAQRLWKSISLRYGVRPAREAEMMSWS